MDIKKIYSCYLLLLAPLSLLFAQQVVPSNENYTMRVSAKESVKTVAEFEQAPVDQKTISITYFDGLGRPKQRIAVGASPDMAPTTNLLTMDWREKSGGTAFFSVNGQYGENEIITGTNPNGETSLLWKCSNNDTASNADGGWNTDYISIDNTKTYRYAVWVKRTGSQDGKTYHRASSTVSLSGSPNSYSDFWSGDLPQLNTWYLLVGVIHPHNYTGGDQGISGVYDSNGNRVLDGTEFRWNTTSTVVNFRSYLFYSTDTNVRQYFWNPTLHLVDGTAHKIDELSEQETISNADIVSHMEYDTFGRQSKQYLPFTGKGALGSYQEVDVVQDINTYYLEKYPKDFEGITDPAQVNAYAEQIYDRSPIGRVTEQSAPGSIWKHQKGSIQYEDPVYTYFPTSISYDQFWEAQDLFYIPGIHNLPSAYNDEGMLVLNNLARLIIEDGMLTLRIRTITEDGSAHPLPVGQIRHLPIASPIESLDLGILTDVNGNHTDYRIGIEDNYLTITATTENPDDIPGGLFVDITYDLTQIEYVTYQTVYYDSPDSHTVKSEQDLNTSSEVARFDVALAADGTPSLVRNGTYDAHQLTKSIAKNENWKQADGRANTAESFTDKSGKVLMTRSFVATASNPQEKAETYNVYDDFGNLTFVIPPSVTINDGISASELSEFIYQYQYDDRNRLIRSKNPGKGWDQIVYNELDQPVLTQNAVLAEETAWLFTKYDALGRVVYTGKYTDTRSRQQLQEAVDQMTTYHEERSTATTIDGTEIYYTNTIFPTTNIALHTISYYDDYNFDIAGLVNPQQVYGESITQNTKLLSTGSKVRVLGTDNWITSVPYYDKKGRGVYAASKNEYLSTTDIIETQLDFTGKVIQSISTHTKGNNTPIVMIDNFTYDPQGRVLTQTQQINDQQEELIAGYVYDELGQVIQKNIGGINPQSTFTPSFTDIEGVTISEAGEIIKTAESAWGNAGLATQEVIENNGYISYQPMQKDNSVMVGLSSNNNDAHYDSIEYAIFNRYDGIAYVYENGVLIGTFESYEVTDRFTIERVNGVVNYKKNGTTFYTSTTTYFGPLVGDFALCNTGVGIENILMNLSSAEDQQSLQKVDYAFNIRGWLQSINEGNTAQGDLFGYEISYTNPTQNLGADPLYNGNISEISWQTANDHTKRSYGYQYDTTDRLTRAISSDGNYDLSGITYDKMGNILSLQRKGHTNADATTFGVMDDLTYTYQDGHKLHSVSDAGNTTFGFKDGNTTGADYTYNSSGSITADRNKGITNIQYNHFELPTQITFEDSDTKKIEYVYTATGSKLKKILTDGSTVTETEYAGGAQYKNGALQFIPTAEGYVEPKQDGTYSYIYQYTDHLGNTRLAYSDKDNSGTISTDEIIEENNYYPFGLSHRGYNNAINGRSHNLKYNNTELEEGLGLDWYEMPLRSYDPTIARWNRIDPVVHYGLSTYNAFDNNPVAFADPSGGDATSAHQEYDAYGIPLPMNERTSRFLNGDNAGSQSNDNDNNANVSIETLMTLFNNSGNGSTRWHNNNQGWLQSAHGYVGLQGNGFMTNDEYESYGINSLESVGLTYVDYGNGDGAATRGTINSALRQITNNIQNGYVQQGYRQGQMTYASGLAGDSAWRYVPGIGLTAESIDWFARGDVSRGILYAGLAVSDIFAIKALATAGGRMLLKAGAKSIDKVSAITLSRAEMATINGAGESLTPNIGRKLDFVFGKATGRLHNIQRSTTMNQQLNAIGVFDNSAGRSYLTTHLNGVLNNSKNILSTGNGFTTRQSLLMGRNGGLLMESVWKGENLITIILKGKGL